LLVHNVCICMYVYMYVCMCIGVCKCVCVCIYVCNYVFFILHHMLYYILKYYMCGYIFVIYIENFHFLLIVCNLCALFCFEKHLSTFDSIAFAMRILIRRCTRMYFFLLCS